MIIFTYIKRLTIVALILILTYLLLACTYIVVIFIYLFREIKLIPFVHSAFLIIFKLAFVDLRTYVSTGRKGGGLNKLKSATKDFENKLNAK